MKLHNARSVGISVAIAGGLVSFAGFLSESTVAFGIGIGLFLLGLLPFVLIPVLPELRSIRAPFIRPVTFAGKKQRPNKGDTHDRRTGNPRYN
jgi:hypothetical protein